LFATRLRGNASQPTATFIRAGVRMPKRAERAVDSRSRPGLPSPEILRDVPSVSRCVRSEGYVQEGVEHNAVRLSDLPRRLRIASLLAQRCSTENRRLLFHVKQLVSAEI
jgi:hypothetical protein